MTQQEAVHILIMSPFYFRLTLTARKLLIEEFLTLYENTLPKEHGLYQENSQKEQY